MEACPLQCGLLVVIQSHRCHAKTHSAGGGTLDIPRTSWGLGGEKPGRSLWLWIVVLGAA